MGGCLIDVTVYRNFALVKLNRPEKLNAFNEHMIRELNDCLDRLKQQHERQTLSAVLISGGRFFCSGADLTRFVEEGFDKDFLKAFAEEGRALFRKIDTFPSQVVASINGGALGGGLELALSCDYIISHKDALFGFPEMTYGFTPGAYGFAKTIERCGIEKAREFILSGRTINGQTAYEIGIVNYAYGDSITIHDNPTVNIPEYTLIAAQQVFENPSCEFENFISTVTNPESQRRIRARFAPKIPNETH